MSEDEAEVNLGNQFAAAWHFKRHDKRKELADAETEAGEAKRGLWADKEPVTPWDWRKHKREAAAR